MTIRPFLALVRKDLLVFFGDRRAVVLSLLAPIILASFMALVMGGIGDNSGRGQIAIEVANADDSPLARDIVSALQADENLRVNLSSLDAAREAVRRGRAAVAVALPEGFGNAASTALFSDADRPTVTVITDPSHAAEAGMVRGLLMQHVMEAVTKSAFSSAASAEIIRRSMAEVEASRDIAEDDRAALKTMFNGLLTWFDHVGAAQAKNESIPARGLSAPFNTKDETIASSKQDERAANYAHAFAGMVVQFVLFGAIEMGAGILLERRHGLWKRLRAAPVGKTELLGSRAVSGTLISLVSITVVYAFGFAVFGIRVRGSVVGFLLVAVAYSLAASCLGLLIAAFGKTHQAARGVSVLVVLIMVMLGGAWIPSFLFPRWLQQITPAIPTRWGVDGFEAMTWRGLGLIDGLNCALALLAFALAFGVLAVARFQWEEA